MSRTILRLARIVLVLAVAYLVVTAVQVAVASRRDEKRPADAIVVLGAAQYNGRPSAVLRARLDHAADLYREGLAPTVWVTGGRRAGDRSNEAAASADYLVSVRKVKASAVRREVNGVNSWQQLAAVSRVLHREGTTRVLLVSDAFHNARIAAISRELGLHPAVSPTHTSPISRTGKLYYLGRETIAVAAGRIVGFRRLVGIDRNLERVRTEVRSG